MIDIKEFEIPREVLEVLLKDHTTHKNIIWGTDQYGFDPQSTMEVEQIISGELIKPRVLKTLEEQKSRTNTKAEVFTPIEIVKKMNDQVDEGFNGTTEDYIKRSVLEVTCGEAPYLVSRYDTSTGEMIPLEERQGLLDRKMRVINNHSLSHHPDTWEVYVHYALRSTYGYEWQGDSLLLARENILYDIDDWYKAKFGKSMGVYRMKMFANDIVRNIIQMDGITMCIPYSDTPAKIMNWKTDDMERFDGKPEELPLF